MSEYVQLRLLSFYKSNVKIAKAVRELFSVEVLLFLSLTCLVAHAAERQHWKRDTLISSRSWNKTMR